MKSVCRRLRLPLRNTGGFTFTKIEDATAGRLIIGPRSLLTQLAWARQAERKRTADSGSETVCAASLARATGLTLAVE